jgi:hypothetical protein
MTFKSYLEHTGAIFKELYLLDIFKINNYLTALFMFQYHHLKNLPEYFTNYFVTNNHANSSTYIIRETHQNFLNVIREQIM